MCANLLTTFLGPPGTHPLCGYATARAFATCEIFAEPRSRCRFVEGQQKRKGTVKISTKHNGGPRKTPDMNQHHRLKNERIQTFGVEQWSDGLTDRRFRNFFPVIKRSYQPFGNNREAASFRHQVICYNSLPCQNKLCHFGSRLVEIGM